MKLAVVTSLLAVVLGTEPQSPHGDIHKLMLSNFQESDLFVFLRQFSPGPRGDRQFLRKFESLNATLVALPKNEQGRLAPQVARYALQNYFAKRHGWRLKGLDRKGVESHSWKALHDLSVIRNKAPLLQSVLSQSHLLEDGFSESEVAALIHTVEALIYDESVTVLDKAYEALNLSTSELLPLDSFRNVLQAYVAMYTHGKTEQLPPHMQAHFFGIDYQAVGFDENDARVQLVLNEWLHLKGFVEDAVQKVVRSEGLDRNLLLPERFSYVHAWKVVELLRDRFGEHQNKDCLDMKQALIDVDPEGQGRVPLKYFYLKGEFLRHWFEEAPSYLFKTGSIHSAQDSDPKILVANYIKGPANCIASFSHHSVCCLTECSDVMQAIEREVAAPSASPEELLPIVFGISTRTVKAPRTLHPALEYKLFLIADFHGGQVPLYGRLFAQWLHFAFPYECTYPHVGQDIFELEEEHMDASQLVSKEELELVNEISGISPAPQIFMDTWDDHEILFFEESAAGYNGMLDWLLTAEAFVRSHEVIIVASLFLFGAFVVSKLQRRKRSQKFIDFDDDFGDFDDPKKVLHKPRKGKELAKDAVKDASKRDSSHKQAKAKTPKDQDDAQNQKAGKTKRKKEAAIKKDDKTINALYISNDKSKLIGPDGIFEAEDSTFKNTQPESEPEDAIAGVAQSINTGTGSWLPASKPKQKKNSSVLEVPKQEIDLPESREGVASAGDQEIEVGHREEVPSMEQKILAPIGHVSERTPSRDESNVSSKVDDSHPDVASDCVVPPSHWAPLDMGPPPCLAHGFGQLVPPQRIDNEVTHSHIAYLPGNACLPPPGLEMVRPPPGLEMMGGNPMSSPMRLEPAFIMPSSTFPATSVTSPPGLAREDVLAAQVHDLSTQLEIERQAREQLEFLLRGGLFAMQ